MQTQEVALFRAAKKKYRRASKSLAYATKSSPWVTKLGLILAVGQKVLRHYSPVCELEAVYKFSTDIFSSTLTTWEFTLRQAICAIIKFIWMDAQRTCIWRTVSSSVRHTTRLRFAFFLTRREREGARESDM